MTIHDALVQWLANGLLDASAWQIVAYTLVITHFTILGVTIFLHRAQAHRALDLGPIPSHFFRLCLWLTTGMVTKEFVAVHRKHHAKCETEEDPHSPQTRGLKALLLTGVELYRAEAKNPETIAKYGTGTPNDWIERNLYTRFSWQGVGLMLIINLALFGAIGATVWAIQMVWIPVWATGVINGLGHWWGYRNFEAPDASTNVSPWGILIGGEELHNNHHTYPTSAKFSVKKYEFDIGWGYIRAFEMLGWAKVRKTAPKLRLGEIKPADKDTLEAVIANRYEVMASYGRGLKAACAAELAKMKAQGQERSAQWAQFQSASRWLHRDEARIPVSMLEQIASLRAASPSLDKLVTMREELRQLWTRTNVSAEQLVSDLQAWCRRAEESGIAELRNFSMSLRTARAQ
ncbi:MULTISPECIES: DesA family fatty acid desaturase [Roseateles]|uniref:Fatty acid desaturase n=1 Tax=Roseateles albus TaxID=2987525 RepID=A0ABT5KIC7_9BURK|nr:MULTISPECIES: fatty acid desaturase [Roseateles]MCV2356237.1 fatty acid desaturase [Paucibacter sp. B2R-40]MDC8773696.1 fatty acid desaturase [Roseateles albus]